MNVSARYISRVSKLVFIISFILLTACSTSPPKNINNICDIFEEKDDWYDDSKESFERWGVPIQVQMAIIHQESSFKHDAETEMQYFLWIIPIGRKSTAYGYAQVKDDTWDWYIKSTRNWGADRDDFEDAVDFIGWYGKKTYDTLKISKWYAKNQYLAYHEGHGGYQRKSYLSKPWLVRIAKKVHRKATRYRAQLKACEQEFENTSWFF